MTTPVDIVMPYGVTVEGYGSRNARIVTNSAQVSSAIALKLPDGPCRVAASWDGPEAVRLVHTGHGYPVEIPAGGGIAPGWLLSALRRAKLSTCRTRQVRHSRRAGAAPSRCTRWYPSSSAPRRGGGVGGGPDHGAGGETARRWHRNNAHRLPAGRARRVPRTGTRGARFDHCLGRSGAGRSVSPVEPGYVAESCGRDPRCGDHQEAAQGLRPRFLRAATVGVLPLNQGAGRWGATSGASDPRQPHDRLRGHHLVATAGGGCAK